MNLHFRKTSLRTLLRYSIPLVIILLTLLKAEAQSSWRTGTVIKKDGTILTGEINDQEWTINPVQIEFRGPDLEVLKFNINEISSFTTNRPARYEAHKSFFDGDSQNIDEQLTSDRNPVHLQETFVFMEVLVNASLGLLRFHDQSGREHFVLRKNNSAEELLNRIYRLPDNKSIVGKNEKYKQQLLLEAAHCTNLDNTIKALRYNEVYLKGIIEKINACQGNSIEPIYTGVIEKRNPDFGITLQIFLSYTEFTTFYSEMSRINSGSGLYLEIYSKKRPGKISIYNELLFKQINQDARNYSNQPLNFKLNRIKLINSFRFSKPAKNQQRTFWGIGITTGTRFNTLLNNNKSLAGYGDYQSKFFEFGLMGSIGKTFVPGKKLKINTELRYELEQVPFSRSSFVGAHNIGLNLGFVPWK